jgi:hypothetical protein
MRIFGQHLCTLQPGRAFFVTYVLRATEYSVWASQNWGMNIPYEPRLEDAERIDNGVLITFDNGKAGLYSASVLYAILSQAEEVPEKLDPEE